MMEQLVKGGYRGFCMEVRETMDSFERFVPSENKSTTLFDAIQGLEAHALLIHDVSEDLLTEFDDAPEDWIEDQMTGLVLRYKCMGGFGDNLHGSVPSNWASAMGADWAECFALQLNHKFNMYYSIFDQDKVFGSRGNFFLYMHGMRNVLPDGKYEINPPWNNQMF
jgi:hypothetical protein